MLVAVIIAVVVGMLVGLPALRIRGVQLAVVTITAAIAIEVVLFRNESVVGPGAKSNNPVPAAVVVRDRRRHLQHQDASSPTAGSSRCSCCSGSSC